MTIAEAERTAHRQAVVTPPPDMASYLQKLLGQKVVALIVGVRDPKAVGRWALGEHLPTPEHEARLRSAFQIAYMLAQIESPSIVRAWFIGMNPQLDDISPTEALRDRKDNAVMEAATAFLAGG